MNVNAMLLCLAASLAITGCGRDEPKSAQPASSGATSPATAPAAPASNTPPTPANVGQPQSTAERREGANPQQQQIDPKQPEQHRDFRHPGETAGPKSPETSPRPGS